MQGEALPTDEQARQINQTIGCCRYVYKHMLARQLPDAYQRFFKELGGKPKFNAWD